MKQLSALVAAVARLFLVLKKRSATNLTNSRAQLSQATVTTPTLPFDPLIATASDLQKLLDSGVVTSEDLVNIYLAQIEKHNHHGMRLHALISTAPKEFILAAARALDQERRTLGKRGPLHGIPIIVKDSICTPSVGLPTTCGSFALFGGTAIEDAVIVRRLLKAGALIIAKANMTEWSNFKQNMMTSGWSAVGGQTQSPYVRGGVLSNATPLGHSVGSPRVADIDVLSRVIDEYYAPQTPAGSSSGSAVAVAAGFAPISIATESNGSIVCPAGRAGVYGLKLTVGVVPSDGCQANSEWIFGAGAMAKSALEVSDTVSTLLETNGLSPHLTGSWDGIRVGFVDFRVWKPHPAWVEAHGGYFQQQDELVESAIRKITADGATVVRDVDLITPAETMAGIPLKNLKAISGYQTREGFARFMAGFEGTTVKTLEDLIRFNLDHAAIELPPEHPGQDVIINATMNKLTAEEFAKYSVQVRQTAANAVESLLKKHNIDVIIGSSDARLAGVAAAAGFPIGNVPLGFAQFNGRGIGLSVLAPAGQELAILKFMSAWEKSLPETRAPPPMLVNWDEMVDGRNLG